MSIFQRIRETTTPARVFLKSDFGIANWGLIHLFTHNSSEQRIKRPAHPHSMPVAVMDVRPVRVAVLQGLVVMGVAVDFPRWIIRTV